MRIRQLSLQLPFAAAIPRLAQPAMPRTASAGWVRSQFRRTDDGAGGRLQTLRRELKFWARCVWSSRALQLSAEGFRDSELDTVIDRKPEIGLRPLRSYLRRGLGSVRRAQAVRAHFEWLSRHLPRAVIDRLYAGEAIPLLGADFAGVEGLGVSLSIACGLGREGELALHLDWQGRRAMSLAFSVLDANRVLSAADPALAGGARIVVGTLQGSRGADAALREVSAAAQRLRPSALLVLAVQALSAAWGLQAPLGVSVESHVYAGYASRRRKVALDYDAAWQDAGGARHGRHYYLLPAAPVLRPDAEVESKRRAQHRRRNALRTGVLAAVQANAGRLLA